MKFIVTLSDMVGVVLIALLVLVWIIFGMCQGWYGVLEQDPQGLPGSV